MEKLKVLIWTLINLPKYRYRYLKTKKIRAHLNLLNSIETVELILNKGYSVCRFGDGELQMISHFLKHGEDYNFQVDTFQSYNKYLAQRLIEVYCSNEKNILICLPYQFKNAAISKTKARVFWEREWLERKNELQHLGIDKLFGDTNFTRFYLDRKDISDYQHYIQLLQKIWKNRDVLIVEGEYSRLGMGNDFFAQANSIQRIICPATNAFSMYDQILNNLKAVDRSKLILIALGHTATVLAYDIAVLGYQAIDVGHIDVEYEWYRRGAKSKIPIPNKYVNEVLSGRINSGMADLDYEQQIVQRIWEGHQGLS
jgi:Domain of unknown function (DUF1792).